MKKTRTTLALALVLVLTLVFAGCGAANKSAMAYDAADTAAAAEPADSYSYEAVTEDAIADYDEERGGSANAAQEQKLIQNIYTDMTVENPSAALAEIVRYARETGGYLLSSNDYYDKENNTGGAYVTVRVPSGESAQFCEYLAELGKIDSTSTDTQDVTSEYYDLETRIAQGKLEIKKLEELLERCSTVDEVLQVRAQLSQQQADVESMEGRMKRLRELTSFDTINIQLSPVRNLVSGSDGRFMTGSELLNGILNGLRDSVRVVVNGAGAAAHVGNDHVPAKFLVEGGGQRAGVGVGVSAGVRGHDQLDGALRPFSQRGAAHEYEHECENESQNFLHSDGSSLSFLGLLPFLPFYMQISRQLDNHFQKKFNRLFF